MCSDNTTPRDVLDLLATQLQRTKQAYYANMPGITYDDMSASAARLLRMRAVVEKMTGRLVKSDPASKKQIAALLRGSL